MRGIVLAILALGVLSAGERPRLAGLKRVAVAVTADPAGDVDTASLQAAVESRLRGVGLRIDHKSRTRLNVRIGTFGIRAGDGEGLGHAFSIHLGLRQPVYLANNTNILTDAVTWEGLWLGVASKGDLDARCAQSVEQRLNEFVAVYQASVAEEEPSISPASARR